jgi:hypothetical protein
MVDAGDSKSPAARRPGSSPGIGTTLTSLKNPAICFAGFFVAFPRVPTLVPTFMFWSCSVLGLVLFYLGVGMNSTFDQGQGNDRFGKARRSILLTWWSSGWATLQHPLPAHY